MSIRLHRGDHGISKDRPGLFWNQNLRLTSSTLAWKRIVGWIGWAVLLIYFVTYFPLQAIWILISLGVVFIVASDFFRLQLAHPMLKHYQSRATVRLPYEIYTMARSFQNIERRPPHQN